MRLVADDFGFGYGLIDTPNLFITLSNLEMKLIFILNLINVNIFLFIYFQLVDLRNILLHAYGKLIR